ncbi:CBS-domain containing protein [Luminiphilus syltensis NOR5-1B]|uniref:CBS-domain containing protein n=1 Tax=Luminiphilus syltensis NOR5-1B TaxID=565045 RepID=B8KXY0_9GAMM|nr:CNNM domain-containing protein [Luminiphilus syltensis]EED34646.1 CBS-domain containing protein [Luminiphilus syltensis NOR5-1B]
MTLLFTYLAIAIGVSFLCSILEAVLLSITPTYLEQLKQERPRSGKIVHSAKRNMDESLSSILILNTFAHTMGAAGVGAQAIQVFGAESETLVAVLLTLAILYFSEIIPKTLGATYWHRLAVPAAFVISWLVRIVYPLVWISTRLTQFLGSKEKRNITREEILALASLGYQDGALISQENEYLVNLLRLREVKTRDILTPRTVVHMLEESTSVSDALSMEGTRQFSRMLSYSDSADNITGKILRTDLFDAERAGKGEEPISQFKREVVRVSEKLPVHKLMDLFIRHKMHLFLVEDQFGQTAGIVTLEDAIETLLGREILDESDTVEDMQALARSINRERLRSVD